MVPLRKVEHEVSHQVVRASMALTSRMEDWYLALTCASAAQPSTEGVFSERDMQALVDTIDTEPDPIPMRWLNAIFGRIFFGLYRTEALEQVSLT